MFVLLFFIDKYNVNIYNINYIREKIIQKGMYDLAGTISYMAFFYAGLYI